MPDEGVEDSIAADTLKRHRDRPWLLVGFGLLAFALLVALSSAHVWPSAGNLWVAAALIGASDRVVADGSPAGSPRAVRRGTGRSRCLRGMPAAPLPPRRSLGPLAAGLLIGGIGIVALVDVATGADVDWRIVLAVRGRDPRRARRGGRRHEPPRRLGGRARARDTGCARRRSRRAGADLRRHRRPDGPSHRVHVDRHEIRARDREPPRRPAGRSLPDRQDARQGDARRRQPRHAACRPASPSWSTRTRGRGR